LEQFGLMGAVYAQYALGVDNPRVGLLNIGEEPTKGNEQALETYALLERNPVIPFVGNCEGRDVLTGAFDVVVCDGFIGNILLKFAEGVGLVALQILKEELPQGPTGKMGAFILRDNLQQVKRRMDYAEYGGGLLLGVNGICVITHGSSKASGVLNAARIAKEAVENKVLERIQKNFSPSIPPGRGG
jgi:glycerol-3-phosphate acyltransferase PlsX